jgi:hypothetical protein
LGAQTTEALPGSHIAHPRPADPLPSGHMSKDDVALSATFAFAECEYRSHTAGVRNYLALPYDDPAAYRQLKKLAASECLTYGSLTMPYAVMRGAMFRAAYRIEFRHPPAQLGEKGVDFSAFVTDATKPASRRYLALMDFAQCVVRADPAGSDAVLRSQVGSSEEKRAVDALVPKLGPCLLAGLTLNTNKGNIEALLSEALYREAQASQS